MSEPTDLPAAEVLDHGAPQASPTRRRRWQWVAGALAALVVGGAGIALGMALSGGGTQPEEVIPANALAFADVDFDPDAGQKVNILRLLNKFPEVRDQVGNGGDLKDFLISQIFDGSNRLSAADVAQWVGDRAGVAVVWDSEAGGPTMVLAVQVSNQQAAQEMLSQHLTSSEFAFSSGYAVIVVDAKDPGSPGSMTADQVVAASASSSLANNSYFQKTMKPLGSGVASIYVDGPAITQTMNRELADLGPGLGGGVFGLGSDGLDGHTGMVLRAEPSALELVGRSDRVGPGLSATPTQLVSKLPPSTVFALGFTGGGAAIEAQWQKLLGQLGSATGGANPFESELARLEAKYNIKLPDDLVTLLGDDFVVAVDGAVLVGRVPSAGLRSVTDPVAAADLAKRLQPVVDQATAGLGVTLKPEGDGLVAATTNEYAGVLEDGAGRLTSDPAFQDALPDANNASFLLWVDLQTVGGAATLLSPQAGSTLSPLQALGVSAGVQDGGATFTARLTFKN